MLVFVTVATHENKGYYQILKDAFEKKGIRLNTLGLGQPWQGFVWRIKLVQNFMNTLANDDTVVVTDAYDVIMIHPELIEEKIKAYNKPIVFSTESDMVEKNPLRRYMHQRVFGRCVYNGKFTPINMGAYAGKVWALKKLFEKICGRYDCTDAGLDDQEIINQLCIDSDPLFEELVAIDTESKIFKTLNIPGLLNRVPPIDLGDFPLDDPANCPNFAHGPGDADITMVANHIGVSNPPVPRQEYSLSLVKNYFRYFIPELAIIALLVLAIWLFVVLRKKHSYLF